MKVEYRTLVGLHLNGSTIKVTELTARRFRGTHNHTDETYTLRSFHVHVPKHVHVFVSQYSILHYAKFNLTGREGGITITLNNKIMNERRE